MKNFFGKVAFVEGISYLLLLLVAMPIKYLLHIPEPVKYVGWAHGVLFIAYIVLLLACAFTYRWKVVQVLTFFFASLLPFAPFWVEKKLRTNEL